MATWQLELLDARGDIVAWTPFEGSEIEVEKVEEILNDVWHVRPSAQKGIGTALRHRLMSEAALL